MLSLNKMMAVALLLFLAALMASCGKEPAKEPNKESPTPTVGTEPAKNSPTPQVCQKCSDGKPTTTTIGDDGLSRLKVLEGYAGTLKNQCSETVQKNCRIETPKKDNYGFYNDYVGYCTTGYGHLVEKKLCKDIDQKKLDDLAWIKTEADADKKLRSDVADEYGKAVNDYVKVPLCQAQFDALVLLVFNIGAPNFKSSTVVRKLNEGDYKAAADAFSLFNKSGTPLTFDPGLATRRATEATLFRTQDVKPEKVPCARGTGDIHLETFDGLNYDLQAVGEFVALKDTDGQVTFQIRLEPWWGLRPVTMATAVAARVDGAKVAIHSKPQPQLYVNGKAINLERGAGMSLGEAGGITFTGTSWVIAWPDGTVAWIKLGGYFDLFVSPGSSAGKLVGLFGNADGKLEGDLVARDGFVLPAEISFQELYGRFAESWRISQDESLFHYAEGESTATYTDRSAPREDVTLDSLDPAARAEAERRCRAAGITAPVPLAECTLDLAVTGDDSFLFSAALAQSVTRQVTDSSSVSKEPGSLMVSGTGKESYFVYDAAGKDPITSSRTTNSVTELLPGTYTVVLNGSRQRVEVTPGQQAVVKAGSLTVSGTGKESYYIYDEAGKESLTSSRTTNSVTELLPGTYVVKLGERNFTASVKAGELATVSP